MTKFAVALMAITLAGGVAAQSDAPAPADTNRAKQEIVKSTTQAQTKQMSGAGYQGAPPPATKSKRLTNKEGQQVMQNLQKTAKDQYRPAFAPPDPAAAKPEKPQLGDPAMREQLEKAKH